MVDSSAHTEHPRSSSLATLSTASRDGSAASWTESSPAASPLMSNLSRLSHSTSRPNLPPQQGYAARTLRSVSRGISSVWGGESQGEAMKEDGGMEAESSSSPQDHRRPSVSSTLDTSSILYPTLENHPAPFALPLLVLNMAALTAVSPRVSNDELLATILRRLEPWVGEEGEGGYNLIVLAAEPGMAIDKARALPGVTWWMWHWRRIPRKYRKQLKRLYICHPSTLTRTVMPVLLPLVSPKSFAKLHIVPSLLALSRRGISLRGVDLPISTLEEEARVLREHPEHIDNVQGQGHSFGQQHPASNATGAFGWGYSAISSVWGSASSYLHLSGGSSESLKAADSAPYWSHDIDDLVAVAGGKVPRPIMDIARVIMKNCTTTEGIFRRSANSALGPAIRALLDLPIHAQPRLNWSAIALEDPLLPPIILKGLLSEMPPIIARDQYPLVRSTYTTDEIRTTFLPVLSGARVALLKHITHLAHHLLPSEPMTRMNARALAITLAPTLISSPDPREDAAMCLQPGLTLPPGLAPTGPEWETAPGDEQPQTLVGLLETWISEWPSVEERTVNPQGTCDCGWKAGTIGQGGAAGVSVAPSPRKLMRKASFSGVAPPVQSA